MKSVVEPPNRKVESPAFFAEDAQKAETVLQELDKILTSRCFRSAARSRQFLEYVVRQKLDGHVENLKERAIGTDVFQRSPDYATGDDPVVRVQAGEVRRRLEQYYQTTPGDSPVSIRLPVGSYSPVFQWSSGEASAVLTPVPPAAPSAPALPLQPIKRRARPWLIAAVCVALASALGASAIILQRAAHKKTTLEEFWSPVFASQQPVMICLAKPVVYRPSPELYKRYSRAHPGTFQTQVERYNNPLPLDPKEGLVWGDIITSSEFGVALGDAYAGVSLSGLFGKMGKPSQVRIGSNYPFADLRNSPAVVVGAFNNRWTMQLTANLHFAFVEKDGRFTIQEQAPGGRVWRQFTVNSEGETSDFAIVSRLLDSKTGQFTVAVAGVSGTGTQAAAEFASNPEYLEKGLRNAPAGWQKRNLEVVLQTTITDSLAGPPRVIAAYYW
jgi:hypothetical protein